MIKRRVEGFTLLEVLVSMALILVALLGVFQLQGQSLRMLDESRFNTEARFLAQDRLSRILAGDIAPMVRSGDFSTEGEGFLYEEEVRGEGEGPEGLLRVRIRIFEQQSSPKEGISVDTLVYKKTH